MDVDQIIVDIAGRDIPLGKGKALDFGCGVGRLSQALADYFDRVVGADVSPTMIGLARDPGSRPHQKIRFSIDHRQEAKHPDTPVDLAHSSLAPLSQVDHRLCLCLGSGAIDPAVRYEQADRVRG